MVVLGDVFAVVAFLAGVCVSAWALTLGMALFFGKKAARARECIERAPWKAFFVGFGITLSAGWISLALLASPLPGAKLAGFLGSMALLAVAFLGLGGLASLVGKRIQPLEPNLSHFRALGRGAGLIVAASLLPLVGWFVFAPLVLIVSLGAGVLSIFGKAGASPVNAQPTFEMGVA